MKTNLTPAKIVEMYLPEYEKRAAEWSFQYRHSKTNLTKQAWIESVFPEALAERDRILCQKQREICNEVAVIAMDENEFDPGQAMMDALHAVLNAPMPELKEE